jgi:hypothetical protein
MKGLLRYLGLPTAAVLLSAQLTSAQTAADFRKLCPSSKPLQLKFESAIVNVDSVSDQVSKGRSEIINCVQIVDAKHEYYVDLVGTNLSNVWTQDGGYLAQNDPFVTRETQYDPTLLTSARIVINTTSRY